MPIAPGRALVTGAGRRLGQAFARQLGEMGWSVALHYMGSAAGAEEAAEEIRAAGGQAALLQANLLDLAEAEALIPRAAEALGGPLTLLINNASIFEHDEIGTITTESWDRALGSNLRAPVLLSQAFAAQAPQEEVDETGLPRATGLILNMIDQRVWKPTPAFMSYSIAKAGLWWFTQTAAQALAPRIRVAAIGPGPTLQGDRQSAEHFDAQRRATLLQRGSNPAEMRAALAWLLAADGYTGQMLALDSGQHLAWRTPDVLGVE